VSTSEWVKVRITAAKTYMLEKKFNKAIHILTDLCYIIPPDMLRIGEDQSNLKLYDYADENEMGENCGGIRFCKQVLAEDEDYGSEFDGQSEDANQQQSLFVEVPDGEQPRGTLTGKSPGWKQKKNNNSNDKFKNKIFIDRHQEQQIVEDFQDTTTASNGKRESNFDPRASEHSQSVMKFEENVDESENVKGGKKATNNPGVFEMENQEQENQEQIDQDLLFENSQAAA